jgi:hypothetical protein
MKRCIDESNGRSVGGLIDVASIGLGRCLDDEVGRYDDPFYLVPTMDHLCKMYFIIEVPEFIPYFIQ